MKPLPIRSLNEGRKQTSRASYDHVYADAADLAVGQERPWVFGDVVAAQKAAIAITKYLRAHGGPKRWKVSRDGQEVSVGRVK